MKPYRNKIDQAIQEMIEEGRKHPQPDAIEENLNRAIAATDALPNPTEAQWASARQMIDGQQKVISDLQGSLEVRKIAIWVLLATVGLLLLCVAELRGCIRHTGDSGEQLPY